MRLPKIKLGPSWPGRSASCFKPIHSLSTEPTHNSLSTEQPAGRLEASLEPLSLSTVPVLQYPTRGQARALVAAAAGCFFLLEARRRSRTERQYGRACLLAREESFRKNPPIRR
jgi:hypothetical protein